MTIRPKVNLVFIVLLLVSVPSFFVLLNRGFYEPHDLHHFADVYEMVRALQSGQFPPRLGPDFSYGFGYPLFNYYYLLPFYMGALFWFLVGSITLSLKLVMISGILLSVFGMYLFLKEITGKFPAFVGSVLYLYTPYRAVEVYVRGAIGEVMVIALIPFVGWSLLKVIKKPNSKSVAIASFIMALLLLSHNYLSFLSLPVIGLILLPYLIKSRNIKQTALSLLGAFVVSLGISIYWLLPALMEKSYISATTPFPLIDHFPFLKQLIIPSWGYGASLWGPGDGLSFQIGLVNLAVVLALGVLFIIFRKHLKKSTRYLCLLALFGFFLSFVFMNVRTYPIWKFIPYYDFIQFPWRLLIYTTFYSSVIAALLVEITPRKFKYGLGIAIVVLGFSLTIGYFHPSKIVYKTDNDYLARFFANRSTAGQTEGVSEAYVGYSEDYLLLPKWVDKRPTTLPSSKMEVSKGGRLTDLQEINPVTWDANVSSSEGALVTFNSYYFPDWKAAVDGQEVEISSGTPYGQIEFAVPKGEHQVKVWYGKTNLKKCLDVVSLFFLLGCVYFMLRRNPDGL